MFRPVFATSILAINIGCGLSMEHFGRIEYRDFDSREPYQGEKAIEADIDLNVGSMTVRSGQADHAYSLDLSYDGNAFQPSLQYDRKDAVGYLNFELKGQGRALRAGSTTLDLRLNPESILRFRANTGVGENTLDLTGLKVESVQLSAGVGHTSLSMLSPNQVTCSRLLLQNGVGALEVTGLGNFGFQEMEFSGGVGAAVIDFSGAWNQEGRVTIKVGLGGIELKIPRQLGVELRLKKSFLTGVDLDGFRKSGNRYLSDNLDRVERKLELEIITGIGGIEIDWI